MNIFKARIQAAFFYLSQTRLLTAIQQGVLSMMPFIVVGSFAILVNNLPIPAYQEFMTSVFGSLWKDLMDWIYSGTINIIGIGVLLSISYYIANDIKHSISEHINPLFSALVSLGCFVIVSHTGTEFLTLDQVGVSGLLLSILVAISSSHLFIFLSRHTPIRRRRRRFSDGSRSHLSEVMSSVRPAALTFLTFALMRLGFLLCGIDDIRGYIYDLLELPFGSTQGDLPTAILFLLFSQIFWFFGLHGSNILENVSNRIWLPNLTSNIAAVDAGQVPAHILSKPFFDVFVLLGGSGATLALIAASLLAFRKANTMTRLSKLSIPFALFNINETIIFGVPLVLNPIFLIPFILTPIVLILISYAATALGLVPIVAADIHWTTPILLGGYMATGSIAGSLLQFFNLMVATLIYIPFIRISERAREKSQHQVFEKVNRQVNYFDNRRVPVLLPRQDNIGAFARNLAYDLERDMTDGKNLFLVFQPQVDDENRLFGVETLLRWKHSEYGFVPPPTIITIAEEAGIDNALNEWIFKNAIRAKKDLCDLGYGDLVLSINISPLQLKNARIFEVLQEEMARHSLDPSTIEIELTENVALDDSKESREHINALKALGTRLAIDDFGMGHTSLFYIRSFAFNTVKLDGSLVQGLPHEKSSLDVVGAVTRLAGDQNLHVIAEMVETEEQRDCLLSLGCRIFQGYLYARPMPMPDLIVYLSEQSKKYTPLVSALSKKT